jgi:Recombinase
VPCRATKAAPPKAELIRPTFEGLADLSARQAAATLNERGIKTAEGGQWHASQVIRVRERLAA